MPTPKEEALETLSGLKADFDAAVRDAQEDGKRWRWLRHYTDPKAREDEFAGYAQQALAVSDLIAKDDRAGATTQLQAMKSAFDAVAADCRAQPMDILESFFGLNTLEAQKFEGYSSAVQKIAAGLTA